VESSPPITVLIVDDDPLVREALAHFLQASSEVVLAGTCVNGREAIAAVEALRPDVVLMDLLMPVLDGWAATREVRRTAPTVKVLALTTIDDEHTAAAVLEDGACGYILKGTRQAALIGAILAAHSGVTVLPGSTRSTILERSRNETSIVLTARERDVLERLGRGLTNAEIARQLFVSTSTVKAVVAQLLQKLGSKRRAEAVQRAVQLGLLG
jgi:DNA-binding NarL/FixJ family response regulator